MLEAAFWGLVTASSLFVGAAIALLLRPSARVVGLTMAFGAGTLIAAVSYELVLEGFETSATGSAFGFTAGCLAFYWGDRAIAERGGGRRKSMRNIDLPLPATATAIVLGTVLDGIPESFVLGATLQTDGAIPLAVVVGVFIANIPEALSATTGLKDAGWPGRRLMSMWTKVVAVSVLAAAVGWWALDTMESVEGAFALGFAGGALLVMVANTLIPEALEHGKREAGLFVALGFALGFGLS
jgi:zinc transporter, ZIP family